MLNKIKSVLSAIWLWLTRSSVNPQAVSLSVKMFLLAFIPYTMNLVLYSCSLGFMCLSVSVDEVTTVINAVASLVFWSLSIVSGVGFVWGVIRKVVTTTTGTNAVINTL